ncbi:MAG: hypothetical protein NC388_04915 [Clostridium sp.]|nr:hypothetical protein [Clostridium sp.]
MNIRGILSALCLGSVIAISCSEEAENLYTNRPAYFVYQYVQSVPQLYTALNNPGEFSTIQLDRQQYVIKNLVSEIRINQTALTSYSAFRMGLAGFIVGLPNIPEPGSETTRVVCYDLACSNCYDQLLISASLQLKESGRAYCRRCGRTYDLNNGGLVSEGEGGTSLYRYRINFDGQTVVINNQ